MRIAVCLFEVCERDYLRERGVAAVRRIERREPHEPVDTTLGLERAVCVLAARRECGGLQAGLLPRAGLDQLGLPPAALGPTEIHAQHDLRPVLGVGATGACVDRHHRVAAVVLSVEERVLLEPAQLGSQGREGRGDLVGHVAVHPGKLLRVVVLLVESPVTLEALRHPGVLRRDLRRLLLVVPEAGRPHLFFELGRAGR
jgi:hypothetical protein